MAQIKLIEDDDVFKVDGEFKCCPLWKHRNNLVWQKGTCYKDIDVLFVGEAPGKEEDLQGKPFVGRSGKILDEWIKESGIEKYAVVNIIKCRPPNNRLPKPIEIKCCLPNFAKQIKELNPKIIVALGRIAISVLINRKEVITNVGKVFDTKFGKVIVFPHPSYILRGANIDIPIEKLREEIRIMKKNIGI